MSAQWRPDIDSLAFQPAGQDGWCVIHRRAIRTLLRKEPTAEECLALFAAHRPVFEAAAAAKRARAAVASGANYHITSRDVLRARMSQPGREWPEPFLTAPDPGRSVRASTVPARGQKGTS
jgi:Protein of unknown function (DUF1488)